MTLVKYLLACGLLLAGIMAFAPRADTADAYHVRLTHCGRTMAEDSIAHVRLDRYRVDDGGTVRITYRCRAAGY